MHANLEAIVNIDLKLHRFKANGQNNLVNFKIVAGKKYKGNYP